jgi:hypothetical protein
VCFNFDPNLFCTKQSQLNLQMVHGKTFPYYNEARITFLPTYKYDVGTDEYDSSDKARIPAWCDRVLTKGHNLRQIHYDTAPLKFSDHRPVYATFQCTITVIDEKKKQEISEGLYKHRRAVVGGHTANTRAEDTDDEDLLDYESIEPGLPPASSDKRKWWLDNGMPARSQVKPPGDGYTRNPQRAPNPFSASTEPDWVKVPRPNPPPPRSLSVRERNTSATTSLNENLERKAVAGNRKLPPVWPPHQQQSHSRTPSTHQSLLDSPLPSQETQHPPRLPRRPSTSSQHSITRKPAPPVPKKPSTLRSESPSAASTRDDGFAPKLPKRINTLPQMQESVSMPMLLPQRKGNGEVNAKGIERWEGQIGGAQTVQGVQRQDDSGPPLPPRRGTGLGQAPQGQAQGQRNLLDDEEDGMAAWKPLRPN